MKVRKLLSRRYLSQATPEVDPIGWTGLGHNLGPPHPMSFREGARTCLTIFAALTASIVLACGSEAPPTAVPVATPTVTTALPSSTTSAQSSSATPFLPTYTPDSTYTPLPTLTTSATYMPIAAPTATSLPTYTPEPTYTPTPIPTATPLPTYTPLPTPKPRPTYTPVPTYTPAPLPTSTPYPTATPYPTSTPYPTPTLVPADAELVVYLWIMENVYVDDQRTSALGATAKAKFDIPVDELQVIVTFRDRGRTLNFSNCNSQLFQNEIAEVSCHWGLSNESVDSLEVVTGVRSQTPQGRMRCEEHQNSTMEELVYTCEFQS